MKKNLYEWIEALEHRDQRLQVLLAHCLAKRLRRQREVVGRDR
jgi:hypothetical protein